MEATAKFSLFFPSFFSIPLFYFVLPAQRPALALPAVPPSARSIVHHPLACLGKRDPSRLSTAHSGHRPPQHLRRDIPVLAVPKSRRPERPSALAPSILRLRPPKHPTTPLHRGSFGAQYNLPFLYTYDRIQDFRTCMSAVRCRALTERGAPARDQGGTSCWLHNIVLGDRRSPESLFVGQSSGVHMLVTESRRQ